MMANKKSSDGLKIDADGTRYWYRANQLHRENGELHRADGPAIVRTDGSQEWWQRGRLHRDDGPAIVLADGTMEWWRDGNKILAR